MRAERDERAEPDQPDRRDDAPRPRRWGRLMFLFALAVVLVGGGAWAWLMYGKHVPALLAKSGGDGVPVVRADPAPTKVRPRDPGGMEVPDRDKLIYERLQGEGAEPRVERLLPQPEAPLRPARAASEPAPQVKERLAKVPTEAQVLAAVPPPLPPDLSKVISDRDPTPEDSPPTDVETAPGALAPNPKDPAASVAPGLGSGRPAPPGALAPPATPERSAAPEIAAAPLARPEPPARAESRGESGYLIQIAAVREPERADAEWERLQRQYPDMLRGLKLFVARADLGDKGVFWRLRAGPFADETAAKNRCAELSRRKVGCLVVKAQG